MCFGIFRRGRGRAPTPPGVVGNASQLALTTQPSSSTQNNVNLAVTPVIQLQDAQGVNVALAGVEIFVSAVVGGTPDITYTATLPGPFGGALTDATGTASFTAFKLMGVVGAYRLEFADVNSIYTRVLSNAITLVSGSAVASATTITVNAGNAERVGQLTTMTVQARDVSGNALTIGGDTVSITISDANSLGPALATDLGNGTYQLTYTPTASGSNTIVTTLNGSPISNSPAVSVVNPAVVTTSPRLRIGLFNLASTDIGKGPGGGTTPPLYGATVLVVTPQNISSIIDAADASDVLVFANFVGARQSWATAPTTGEPCFGTAGILIYRPDIYFARLQGYSEANLGTALYTKVVDALARRRLIAYVVDEPFHNQFCNSISKTQVNEMARWHKDLFGRSNTITCVRVCGARTDGVLAMSPAPSGGYPDIDYCWLQYEGPLHQPRYPVTTTQTPLQFYQNQLPICDSLGLGVVFGMNWLDGGSATCWNYLNMAGPSFTLGRIVGTFTQPGSPFTAGQSVACGTAVGTQTRWVTPPSELQTVMSAILGDATLRGKSPCLMLWSHSPRNVTADTIFVPLELRSDQVDIIETLITQGEGRTSWDDWRTPK